MGDPPPLHRSRRRAPLAVRVPRMAVRSWLATMSQVAFRVLGPLEATVDGQQVALSGRRERALLGVLLLNAGSVVSIAQLIDGVWGDPAPRSARHMVHEYV